MGYCSQALSPSELEAPLTGGNTTATVGGVALRVSELNYSYASAKSGRLALEQLNFDLEAGQFHALLGPNGAGKSTLFALLTRLFVSRQGSIQLLGEDFVRAPAKALGNIGVVFQQTTLDLDLSVEQNLLYQGALQGLDSRTTRARMSEELANFGLHNRLKDKVRQLNGGHRRRLEIVRALLHRPKVLLLDEPTVGLDLESRQYLNQRVRQLCRERDLCVLWATHLMEEIRDGDWVMLLHQGKLRAQGHCRNLCQRHAVTDITALFNELTGVTV